MIYINIKSDRILDWQFLLGIIKISGILSHKVSKYIITNAIYFDLEMFLSNILMIGLFRSNPLPLMIYTDIKKGLDS